MKIIRQIEWDMGHRITNHKSKCRNLHGHRYKLEICLEGRLIDKREISDEGMVMDFGDIKTIAMKQIHNLLDHGFIVWERDKILTEFYNTHPEQKHILVPFTTTCENITKWIFKILDKYFKDIYGTDLRLHCIKLWETPSSVAICEREDVQ